MRRPSPIAILAALIILGLAACQPGAEPTATPTRTPGGPLDELTAAPTGTPTPEPPTATPAPPPVPAGPFGPDSYPDGTNPLTGLPVSNPALLNRAPLAIKVSNDPLARPQSGLSQADLVFEHYAEGGVTRFTAIYYSQTPELVGSVRSGRLLDLEIVPMFDALFTASGFSEGVRQRINVSSWAARNFSGPFYAEPYLVRIQREGLALEHTLFAHPADLWQLATDQGVNNPPDLTPGLAFRGEPNAGGTPATHITIDYGIGLMRVEWTYDPALGAYRRVMGDQPHIEYLTGEQLTAANVLALSAIHVETDIIEDGYNGLWSVEIQVWGEGPASLFRDGQRIEGWWRRYDPEQMLQFTDLNGNTLYLRPGNTWFELVPAGFDQLYVEP
jgi:hypothetical protein